MIKVQKLREILARLPDDAELIAYEGEEGTGLNVFSADEKKSGFIKTGHNKEPISNDDCHSLEEFGIKLIS